MRSLFLGWSPVGTTACPVYVELADGNTAFLGRARLIGSSSVQRKVPLKGLKTKPQRAMVNYYDDVLAASNAGCLELEENFRRVRG